MWAPGANGGPYYAYGSTLLTGHTVQECVAKILEPMPEHLPTWDSFYLNLERLHQWTDHDAAYAYTYRVPGCCNRKMAFYEGWRTEPNTGAVTKVSQSLPVLEALSPLRFTEVRSRLCFCFQRFTPVDNGRSTFYENVIQLDLGGWLPAALCFSGILDSVNPKQYRELLRASSDK